MRQQVQKIFKRTPKDKQVLMFSATINKDVREVCKKFTQNVRVLDIFPSFGFDPSPQAISIFIDDESKLTLHGLQQYYVKLDDKAKNRQLTDILDALDFNQVVIFVKVALLFCADLFTSDLPSLSLSIVVSS